jgi:TetR/AcrR family transcriptional regulator
MKDARNTILESARELFAQKGYAASSIREISQAAGVTKPVIYYHFKDKEHLYLELMLDMFNQTGKNLLRLSKYRGSLRQRLIEYVSSEFRNCRRDPNNIRLLFRMMFSPEGEYPEFNFVKEFQREREVIAGIIHENKSEISQTDAELMATALMGMILIEVLEYLFTGRRTLTPRNAERLVDLLLKPASKSKTDRPKSKIRGDRK